MVRVCHGGEERRGEERGGEERGGEERRGEGKGGEGTNLSSSRRPLSPRWDRAGLS